MITPRPDALTVVIVSHNEGELLSRTVESFLCTVPAGGEIVVVDDLSTDGSTAALPSDSRVRIIAPPERLGVARARNLGARQGSGDILVFSDAHVTVPEGWPEGIAAGLARKEVGAVGPVVSSMAEPAKKGYGFRWRDPGFGVAWLPAAGSEPYPVPFLAGGFSAMRREVFDAVQGFDEGMILWGMEDAELSLRLWTRGYDCLLLPEVDILHFFRAKHPYKVGWPAVLHNQLRTALVHFGPARVEKVIAAMVTRQALPAALAQVVESDVWRRRDAVRAARQRDDDWFFQRFGLDW